MIYEPSNLYKDLFELMGETMNRDYGLENAPGAGNYPHISKGNAMGGT